MNASRRPSGATDRYVVTHSPPKLWPSTLHEPTLISRRIHSASRTIASARECTRRSVPSWPVIGLERPVPRWSSMSTRKSCSARSSQPNDVGWRVGREPSKPGPPWKYMRYGRSRPSGSAISRTKTVSRSPSGCAWSTGPSTSCPTSRSPGVATGSPKSATAEESREAGDPAADDEARHRRADDHLLLVALDVLAPVGGLDDLGTQCVQRALELHAVGLDRVADLGGG